MRKIFVIVGPTSTGKTSLALDLCCKFGGSIVSADSRQIYKYMDIGTGKLPVDYKGSLERDDAGWKINGVKVYGYDLATPDQYFSGFDYAQYALNTLRKLPEASNVFLVGGTGFYIDLVTGRVKPSYAEPDFNLREELGAKELSELSEQLLKLNPEVHQKTDLKNKVRVIRALEREMVQAGNCKVLDYMKAEYVYLGLTADRESLFCKVDNWAEQVWKSGLLKEVSDLIDKGYTDSPKMSGLVYKSALSFINGEVSEVDALQRMKYDLHAYIRRQQTYFKKNPQITWFDINASDFKETVYNPIMENKWINN